MVVYRYVPGEDSFVKNIPNNELYNKISEWLDIYHSTGSETKKAKMRTNIVANMLPVVKKLAKTIARRSYDPIDDLVQAGSIGLLRAIELFSKDKGMNFRVYAGYFIIGEMRHYIRDKLKTIHVPRHIQELCIRINNFTETLTPEELNRLTSAEVAMALDVSPKSVDYALMADRRSSTLSLENLYSQNDNNRTYDDYLLSENSSDEPAIFDEIKIIYKDIIKLLPAEEQLIIDMYYNQDMNQREISELLSMSKMSVYRRIKNAFSMINDYISKNSEKKQKILEYFQVKEEYDESIQ